MTTADIEIGWNVAAMSTERLEAETCTLAAQLAAANCRFLILIGELARRETWRSWGTQSLAHWLSWKCGLGLHTAREHVRVAVALHSLPETTEVFSRGELSYSKVRAITRVATPAAESELVEFAKVATASQVERTVGAYRGVVRNVNPEAARDDRDDLRVRYREDGSVTITVDADVAVKLLDAADAARSHLRKVTPGVTRSAALEHVVVSFLQPDAHDAPDAQITVHTDVNLSAAVSERDGIALPVDAIRRLGCDGVIRRVRDGDDGTVHDVGRRRRTVSGRLRRVLVRRDGDRCRWPGCQNRHYLHAHHIRHWADGGPTNRRNLVLLCSFHHRLVHEGRWWIEGDADGDLTFHSTAGEVLTEEPVATPRVHWRDVRRRWHRVRGDAITTAHGEPLDLHWTVCLLCDRIPPDEERPRNQAA